MLNNMGYKPACRVLDTLSVALGSVFFLERILKGKAFHGIISTVFLKQDSSYCTK